MKISVITIVYNDKRHIECTMYSVLRQTARKSIEYIIIDGASTDGTSELIRKQVREVDVYICEKDNGIYDAMNKGVAHSAGDFVIFMNSGDCFTNDKVVENVLKIIEKQSIMPYIVYGDYKESNNGVASTPIPARSYSKIWYGPVASHQSTFYNLHFLNNKGISYDTSYRIAADYKLTLEVIHASNGNVLQLPFCISDFDISGLSNVNQDLGLYEANRARREILGWGWLRETMMTCLLLAARMAHKYGGAIYRILRRL